MGKKISIIFVSLLLLVSSLFGCGSVNSTKYTIEFGEVCKVPYYEGCKYSLKDKNKNEVALVDYAFVVEDFNGYTLNISGSVNKNIEYVVVDSTAPIINSEYSFKNILGKGSRVELPVVNCTDAGSKVDTTYSLKFVDDNSDVEISNNGFIPNVYGTYALTISAKDQAGNESKKEVYYNVLENGSKLSNVIANFSNSNGLDHVGNPRGFTKSYSTNYAYNGQKGSTKLSINNDSLSSPSFILDNPALFDISSTKGFGLSIYNDTKIVVYLAINWTYLFSLIPGQWNEVFISPSEEPRNWDYSKGTPSKYIKMEYTDSVILKEKSNASNIQGMYFALYTNDGSGLQTGNIYLSDMYVINNVSVKELNDYGNELLALPAEKVESNANNFKLFFKSYKELEDTKKSQITSYKNVLRKYANYLIDKHHVIGYEDTFVDTSNQIAFDQLTISGSTLSINNDIPLTETGFEQDKTLVINNAMNWQVEIKPSFTLTENDGSYKTAVFYIWCPEVYFPNGEPYVFYLDYHNTSKTFDKTEDTFTLNSNGWTRIEINLYHTSGDFCESIVDATFDIYCGVEIPWDQEIPAGMNFRISSIKGFDKIV